MLGNTWEATPSYGEVCQGIWHFTWKIIRDPNPLSLDYYWTVVKQNGPGFTGICFLVALAVAMTWARQSLTNNFIKRLALRFELTPENQLKLPESFWRFLSYSVFFLVAFYCAVLKYRYFQQPSEIFTGWHINKTIPYEVTTLYSLEFSYYIHSLYTLFFLDTWRKDSYMLMFHHVLTMLLVGLSYLARYTESGCLVILFHDGCDVLLELSKVLTYFRVQGGRRKPLFEKLSLLGFGSFVLTWFVSRLYFYPLKPIYQSTVAPRFDYFEQMPAFYVCYFLTIFLLAMNFFWSAFILFMLIRLVTGGPLQDAREFQEKEK